MATIYTLHPETPQTRKVEQIREALQRGAVMLYPTDTVYAIGCDLNSKAAIERVRQIKRLSNEKPLTFLCPSLSNIASYTYVADSSYRLVRRLVPGPYTFLLPATKLVPRLVMSPKRKTTGIRVPDHAICQALLQSLGNPVISSSAPVPADMDHRDVSKPELFDFLGPLVDIVIDDEDSVLRHEVSTVLDLTGEEPVVLRQGLGWEAVDDLPLALEVG
ncbi:MULTISPECIES: L-threonylcarbamoyladenylate synthase [unclassified Leptolyngbya]|uniref:L-threonylcarbamoyladenylate synthase n=1 Tax=unclassified Leptolyngbya TaxID=2650499 RepID=UPI0016896D9D|nr:MULTISPECIES: L-threonylcarbamoyladenylate synthase [unclassified Leptolyngbya]MBD1910169.1 threonylcarbamoyl-AMP synthase [Leptolyngbya sp. FACHB-8]MBD2153601.1 threonylcarbamoyl-AMP synthase [Leptolyngbya sp. FACHB-16]